MVQGDQDKGREEEAVVGEAEVVVKEDGEDNFFDVITVSPWNKLGFCGGGEGKRSEYWGFGVCLICHHL